MIFDAKFTKKKGKLPKSRFSDFAVMVKDLELNEKKEQKIVFDKFIKFDTNCILTNGNGLPDNKKYYQSYNVKIVENFNTNKKLNVIG